MKNLHHHRALLQIAGVVILLLTACQGSTQTGQPAPEPIETAVPSAPQGTLTVALAALPRSLDPAITPERQSENAAWQMYASLQD